MTVGSAAEIDFEDLYEADDDGQQGMWMGVAIRGLVENDVAIPIAWAAAIEAGMDVTFTEPRRTYMRKVPHHDGGWVASYSRTPGRGASPATVVEVFQGWREKCHKCPWTAVVGIPVSRVSDAPSGAKYVYFCREHGDDFDRRWRAAVAAEMERLKAEAVAS